jgi:twitching motility protein PilT
MQQDPRELAIHLFRIILNSLVERGGSDFHVRTNKPPYLRVHGELQPDVTQEKMRKDMIEALVKFLVGLTPNYSEAVYEEFCTKMIEDRCANFSCSTTLVKDEYYLPDVRMRINCFADQDGVSVVGRILSDHIRSLKDLGFEPAVIDRIYSMCNKPSGLILVTGPTGSGKTTTLAACLNHINETRNCHIITIEDPIEILYPQYYPNIAGSEIYKSLITQREVPRDVQSFGYGLHDALRQDPNVILVGELRSLETLESALTASETGHLVFATLHTPGGFQTINRIISAFPADRANFVTQQLSVNLNCILSQRLLRRIDGAGRVLCYEYLENIDAIRAAIAKGDIKRIAQSMNHPCVQWNARLQELYDAQLITEEVFVANRTDLQD